MRIRRTMTGLMSRNMSLKTVLIIGLVLLCVARLWPSALLGTICNQTPFSVKDGYEIIQPNAAPLNMLTGQGPIHAAVKDLSQFKEETKGDSYKSPVRPLKLVSGFGADVILFSAILGNFTGNSTWDKLSISGWEVGRLNNQTYSCCVAYASGTIKTYPARKVRRGGQWPMKSSHFICALSASNSNDIPVAATLTDSNKPQCHIFKANYVDVEYSYKHPGEIILFVKVTYGNVSAYDLLAWFEIHRLQGVNKFIMYPYQVPRDVMKVLRYYEWKGLLDIIPYSRHNEAPFESVGEAQWYNDQEVCEYDALERLRGYKYIISFDVDEYILSRKGESWPSLFDRLFRDSKDGAAFWFRSYVFVRSWNATDADSPFSVARYTMRTDIMSNTPKLVVDPSKLKDVGLATHFVFLADGYKTHMVEPEDAAIHHYRACRREWLAKDTKFPCYSVKRNEDRTMLEWFKKVETNVNNLVSQLGI